MEIWIIPLTAVVSLLAGVWLSVYLRRSASLTSFSVVSEQLEQIRQTLSVRASAVNTAAEAKRLAIASSGPKTFYYLDETQIRELYPQIVSEAEPSEIETQEQSSSEAGIKATLKVLEPSISRGSSKTTTKKYEVDTTPATMYNRVETFLFGTPTVTFGVEDFDYDDSSIKEFRSTREQMKTKFGFDIPKALEDEFVGDKMREVALQAKSALSVVKGYVAVQDEFLVQSSDGTSIVLGRLHPLSSWLTEADRPAGLEIVCGDVSLTPVGLRTFTPGNSVKITCLGKIVRWSVGTNDCLVINPIAIY
jgi:hypothetical protein